VPDIPRQTPKSKLAKLREDLATSHLETGETADLIEAVAEGVVFNSTALITRNRVNRLLILRPKISRDDFARNLTTVFLLLDRNYDYRFDFRDPIRQCCTEILYRALNHLGEIKLQLTNRMGLPTLSADDIINEFIKQPVDGPAFQFIALIEHDQSKTGQAALIQTGDTGLHRLHELMN
jgi:hypothetical protein